MKTRGRVPLHPFLFAVFSVAAVFARNAGQLESAWRDAILPFVAVMAGTVLLTAVAGVLLKNIRKAALAVSVFLFVFFSYGYIYDIIGHSSVQRIPHKVFFALIIPALAIALLLILRTKKPLHDVTMILNTITAALVLMSAVNIVMFSARSGVFFFNRTAGEASRAEEGRAGRGGLPDVYYVILDGYPRNDVIKSVFGYDNGAFTRALEKRGFFVAKKSTSNYSFTRFSLASSLNMTYLDFLENNKSALKGPDVPVVLRMVEKNKATDFLKSKGYKFVHFGSDFTLTARNRYADEESGCSRSSEFAGVFLRTTLLLPFYDDIIRENRRQIIMCSLEKLEKFSDRGRPAFVFVHITALHPPYIFGKYAREHKSGAGASEKWDGADWNREGFIEQIEYLNGRTLKIVDALLATKPEPVIILQGDHGSAGTFKSNADYENPTDGMLRERMSILNAYHLPEGGNKLLYDSISPVNSFRVIFNFCFGTHYSLLPDKSYFSNSLHEYVQFHEVTNKIK